MADHKDEPETIEGKVNSGTHTNAATMYMLYTLFMVKTDHIALQKKEIPPVQTIKMSHDGQS